MSTNGIEKTTYTWAMLAKIGNSWWSLQSGTKEHDAYQQGFVEGMKAKKNASPLTEQKIRDKLASKRLWQKIYYMDGYLLGSDLKKNRYPSLLKEVAAMFEEQRHLFEPSPALREMLMSPPAPKRASLVVFNGAPPPVLFRPILNVGTEKTWKNLRIRIKNAKAIYSPDGDKGGFSAGQSWVRKKKGDPLTFLNSDRIRDMFETRKRKGINEALTYVVSYVHAAIQECLKSPEKKNSAPDTLFQDELQFFTEQLELLLPPPAVDPKNDADAADSMLALASGARVGPRR